MDFQYADGARVMSGDRARTREQMGVVESIIRPGTREARELHCPNGGVLFRELREEPRNLVIMTPAERDRWADLVLIARQSV